MFGPRRAGVSTFCRFDVFPRDLCVLRGEISGLDSGHSARALRNKGAKRLGEVPALFGRLESGDAYDVQTTGEVMFLRTERLADSAANVVALDRVADLLGDAATEA